jgi:hypothetical protein
MKSYLYGEVARTAFHFTRNAVARPLRPAGEPERMAGMPSTKRAHYTSLIGQGLVGVSALLAVGLWHRTCGLGGFHCFDGVAGRLMLGAQFGMLSGLVLSLCSRGVPRLVFSGIAFLELVFCYFSLLRH